MSKNDIVPVSVRLKTNIKTAKGLEIIKRAEKQLLNECVRSINNQLEMFMLKRDTCINKLKNILRDQNLIQECEELMKKVVESRHMRVLERQKSKYEVLHQQKVDGHSNQGHCTNKDIHSQACPNQQETPEETRKWVINLSSQPLTEIQEKLLAWGPKFVIKPKQPPVEEYITAIEKACTKLDQGPVEELRVEVKKVLRKAQNANKSPSNITKE